MSTGRHPLFVERATYRKRRMADAARLLPIFGVVLFALPMLWHGEGGAPARTSHMMAYIFGVWLLLALLGAGLSAYLASQQRDTEDDEEA
jgi:hypothetical protein